MSNPDGIKLKLNNRKCEYFTDILQLVLGDLRALDTQIFNRNSGSQISVLLEFLYKMKMQKA